MDHRLNHYVSSTGWELADGLSWEEVEEIIRREEGADFFEDMTCSLTFLLTKDGYELLVGRPLTPGEFAKLRARAGELAPKYDVVYLRRCIGGATIEAKLLANAAAFRKGF
jgi:hypothetical protein